MNDNSLSPVKCCIVGGGPAGIMLGYLLARAGVTVTVLEKHGDFLRDFRGDTIHPSTLEVIRELGLLEEFLKLPHQRLATVRGRIAGNEIVLADMKYLGVGSRFIAMMPQWDFLNFFVEQGRRYPGFHLRMQTEVTNLSEERDRVVGVIGDGPAGPVEIRADLVVGADGRNSVVRERARLPIENIGAPQDVLWMRVSRRDDDPEYLIYADKGKAVVLLTRGTHWQCGITVPKGAAEELRAKGIEELRARILENVPFLGARMEEVRDWSDVKLLTVKVDRLRRWHRPGLLCIGDAAHAMSPIGGVGINLAIQDAVAAANILARPLREGTLSADELEKVQRRREFPAKVTQRVQGVLQKQTSGSGRPPWPLRIMEPSTLPKRMRTRFIGLGIRPEHVKIPDVCSAKIAAATRDGCGAD